jgi:Flp pilus assembly protein TadG
MIQNEGGALALVTVLLLPLVLLVTLGVLELGAVRVTAERARLAADLATVTAVNDQDESELARSGRMRPSADAEAIAREHFGLGLEPLRATLAEDPAAIAASADVEVFPVAGSTDPRTGRVYPGPTVRLAADLPILTPAFAAVIARPVTTIHVFSASSAR